MADVIDMAERRKTPNPGNGAREALLDLFASTNVENPERFTDVLLGELWMRGFKIVPLEPRDDR